MRLANLEQLQEENTDSETDGFYGASIVTDSGEEIPITEKMLQRSFSSLIEAWEKAREKRRH